MDVWRKQQKAKEIKKSKVLRAKVRKEKEGEKPPRTSLSPLFLSELGRLNALKLKGQLPANAKEKYHHLVEQFNQVNQARKVGQYHAIPFGPFVDGLV